jgi:hypothetical protein
MGVQMKIWRTKRFQIFAALFAFAVFGGYLVADSITDATQGCASESSQESGSADDCAVCLTCSHGGALLVLDSPADSLALPEACDEVVLADERVLDGPPARIDHPPQLA